ncbi:hypothetical protein, partial [Klebsiella pneumoniae]|uniref:hypothetical protein n=1 Tax=Klebsiella pneumoniae TaxID=573 RepID=UPI003A84CE47
MHTVAQWMPPETLIPSEPLPSQHCTPLATRGPHQTHPPSSRRCRNRRLRRSPTSVSHHGLREARHPL